MISFHYEAALEASGEVLDLIHSFGVKAGIVINPDCPVEKIFPYLDKADYVLLMSVFAGFGGQKFIPETLDRIKQVRKELKRIGRPEVDIEVDGGVGPDNAAALAKAGATILETEAAMTPFFPPCLSAYSSLFPCNPRARAERQGKCYGKTPDRGH